MPSNLLSIVGVTALFGTIATCWNQIKAIFNQVFGLFVLQITSDRTMVSDGIISYLNKNFTKLPSTIYNINTFFLFHKKFNKKIFISVVKAAAASPVVNYCIFYKGFNIMVVKIPENNNSEVTLSCLKFFNKPEVLIRNIMDCVNYIEDSEQTERVKRNEESSRFFVRNLFGTLEFTRLENNRHEDEDHPSSERVEAELPNCDIKSAIEHKVYKIIGYDEDDVVFSSNYDDSYMEYLAFPKDVHYCIKELELWKSKKDWYRERGIPWKRGIFLYGKHGCGKTAFTRALGEKLNMPVFVIYAISMTNTDLLKAWATVMRHSPCIVLFEDIDNVFHKRESKNKNTFQSVLSFDTFLNVLDGVEKNEGILTIVTTNKPEEIDEALCSVSNGFNGISSRPGRIDRTIELKEMDSECRRKVACRILKGYDSYIDNIVDEGEGDTGAQFNERCVQLALHLSWIDDQKKLNENAKDLKAENLIAFEDAKKAVKEIDEIIAANDF